MAIRDGADPAVGKSGFAENTAHSVGRHCDREDISERSIADDRDAKGHEVLARNHSEWTYVANDGFLIAQHLFEAFAIRRRPEFLAERAQKIEDLHALQIVEFHSEPERASRL